MTGALDVVMVVRRPVSEHGGVERVVRGLLDGLSEARPGWRLWTATAFSRTGWLEGLDGVADVVAALRLGWALRHSQADVLLLHAPETAWGIRLLQPRSGPRPSLVVVWHGAGRTPHLVLRRPGHPAAWALAELRARLEVLALPADQHVVVHAKVLDVLRAEHGHTGGAVVVDNTLRAEQVERLTARPTAHPERPTTALWLGQAGHRKGLDVALEALARARRTAPELRLVVAGVPAGPPVDGVEQVGVVAPDDVPALVHRCDLLLFPTRYEAGGSLVVLEALVAGLPAVVSDVVPASVIDGTNGRRITGHDPDDYAAALLELREPAAYAAAVAATAGAAQQYGPEAGTAAYARVLEEAAASARARRAAAGAAAAGAPGGAPGETGTQRASGGQDGGARTAGGAARRSPAVRLLHPLRRLRSREPSCPPPPPSAGP